MRFLTAGESHGNSIVAIIEGFPKGVEIKESFINQQLSSRMYGYGRGKRMEIEADKVEILSGLRNKVTLGSPIAMVVPNKDQHIFPQKKDNLEPITVPRPAHADLAGAIKYNETDIRNILERSSARETVARVIVGAVCRQFLSLFGIEIVSFVSRVANVSYDYRPQSFAKAQKLKNDSKVAVLDKKAESRIISEIKKAHKAGDTLGGNIEVWAKGVPAGLGSCMHWDQRIDSKIAAFLMSIPSVKGVEIGQGFNYAGCYGSKSHDEIFHSQKKGFYRRSNNSGGIDGGISNGEMIVSRLAVKPIPTLMTPLSSVDLKTKKKKKASKIRSDVCVVESVGVISEAMLAICLTQSFLDKFGADDLKSIKLSYNQYLNR